MSTINPHRRPFLRFFAPEAEPGSEPAPAPEPAPADPAADPAPSGDPAPTDPPSDPEKPETFSREYVEKLRRENATARDKAKTDAASAAEAARNELTQSIGKALGLVKDDEPVSVETLTTAVQERDQTITEKDATIQGLTVKLALVSKAGKLDADLEALLDSRAFATKADKLDPSADDFDAQVESLVKETVASNPGKFKRVQVAAGTGSTTHTGEQPPADPSTQTVDDIRKERQKRRGLA